MTDKEKLHQILSSLWKNDDSVGKTYYNQALQDVQITIDSLQEDSVSEDLEAAAEDYGIRQGAELKPFAIKYFKAGAKYKEEQFEKCAIKTEVCERITQNGLLPSVTVLVNDCKPNEKVKVIVIKED